MEKSWKYFVELKWLTQSIQAIGKNLKYRGSKNSLWWTFGKGDLPFIKMRKIIKNKIKGKVKKYKMWHLSKELVSKQKGYGRIYRRRYW